MIVLHAEKKQLRNKTIDIFLLANNYHSIAGKISKKIQRLGRFESWKLWDLF